MANIKSIGGNPIVLGLDGLSDEVTHGYNPSLSVGRADALTGADETAQWATRESTGSGSATVRSVQGAAVGWNQISDNSRATVTTNGITFTNNGDGSITVSGTATSVVTFNSVEHSENTPKQGHVYLLRGCPANGSSSTYMLQNPFMSGSQYTDIGEGRIYTDTSVGTRILTQIYIADGVTVENITFTPQLFDLTQIFGAGNEPSTVAEFEAMYPEPYYPYSAPTLKPVQIAGIQSVGFNLIEGWEIGSISFVNGTDTESTTSCRTVGYIHIISGQTYCVTNPHGHLFGVRYYDANLNYLGSNQITESMTLFIRTFKESYPTTAYVRLVDTSTTMNTDTCMNISNSSLNGTYKPYMTDAIEWTTQTLRAAGSVRDELTADELVTRVGVVDLGTLTWDYLGSYAYFRAAVTPTRALQSDMVCDKYQYGGLMYDSQMANAATGIYSPYTSRYIYVKDTTYTDAATFKTAMNGVMCFYVLETPTEQPISPALPMTYKVQQGGTEYIIVPDGEVSAAPILTVAEGESAATLVMDALACIATPDGPVATANHAINTYLTMQGKLYKVTRAIAVGETITPNTNVTETTVMAELIARTA